ncbi:hypothetical protein QTP70_028954 [Hemibagrus guttatus]|uniref:Ras association domain-containing protein 5 n=1 Tax=Hemibagrus guttatus TaxID=175788 RepID=A0AAE0Q4H4_9TELE|nr:hypothetical protein QTP70_028954 [Hemibagrus guttatus]
MASVTLGQHPAQHHLDPEKLFFRKIANEGKKLMRKQSREKMTRERSAVAATEEAALRLPLNKRPSLDTVSGTALEMCDSSDAGPPRSTDGTTDADRVPAAQCALERACGDAAQTQTQTRSLADAQNANANNNGIIRNFTRRSSAKYINELSPRSGGKRAKFRSLSADGDTLEGIQLERLTQGRRGVVKLLRTGQQRRQAWSIFDQDEPRETEEKGEGHRFLAFRITQDWCDACNRRIESMASRCEYLAFNSYLYFLEIFILDKCTAVTLVTYNVRTMFSSTVTREMGRKRRRPQPPPAGRILQHHQRSLEWYRGPLEAPQMTGSNSMSSGYCSLDEENDDSAFFTAKTTFFRRAQAKQQDKDKFILGDFTHAGFQALSEPPKLSDIPVHNTTKEVEEEKQQSLTEEEVKAKIEEYNSQVTENGMKLAADGTYNGFIKVHLKLRRPVTLSQDTNSSWNTENSSAAADITDKRTSFYLPSEAVKQLHVSSTNTVKEVIEGLLRKYMVQDNPLKFALYKQVHRHGQDLFQKLPDTEHPLLLRLLAGPDLEKLSFVLKENETEEVEWHAFSVPELQNFLAILGKEENDRVKQVQLRYTTYRKKLLEALEEVQKKPG